MQKHDHPIERAQELTTCSSAIHRFPRRQACRNIQVTEHHIKRLMLHWCTYVRMPIYVYTHYVSIHYLRYGSIYCVCSDNSSTFGAMPSTLGVNCKESSSMCQNVTYSRLLVIYSECGWLLAVVLLLFFRASQSKAEDGFVKQRIPFYCCSGQS